VAKEQSLAYPDEFSADEVIKNYIYDPVSVADLDRSGHHLFWFVIDPDASFNQIRTL